MAFTVQEYIDQHKMQVNIKDPVAMRMINHHLIKLGFKRVRRPHNGVSRWVWVSVNSNPEVERTNLIQKLKEIENETANKD